MRWSFPLARMLGIQVDVHASFLLLLGWISWISWQAQGWAAVPWSLALILLLFVCVTLHEFGHCVVAQRYGVQVRRITLLPIGGVAHLGAIPERPLQELLIAIGGPLVNVVIASLLIPFSIHWSDWRGGEAFPVTGSDLVDRVIQANVAMLVFNLIPAFPMDGGRMLRAMLAMLLPYETATSLAATLGRGVAVLLAAWGFLFNPWLAVIGVFVYLGALGEERMVHLRHRLAGRTIRDFLVRDAAALEPGEPVTRCLDLAFERGQEDFVVLAEGRIGGLLPRERWVRALRRGSPDVAVETLMQRRFACLREDADLYEACRLAANLRQDLLPVVSLSVFRGFVRLADLHALAVPMAAPDEKAGAARVSESGAGRARGLDLG